MSRIQKVLMAVFLSVFAAGWCYGMWITDANIKYRIAYEETVRQTVRGMVRADCLN